MIQARPGLYPGVCSIVSNRLAAIITAIATAHCHMKSNLYKMPNTAAVCTTGLEIELAWSILVSQSEHARPVVTTLLILS